MIQKGITFHTVLKTPLKATLEQAWPQLWRKAYDTKQFVPGLNELHIHQKTDEQVLRTMTLGQLNIKERIVKDDVSHTVYFHNITPSDFKGLIYNSIYEDENKQLILQFGSNSFTKNGDKVPLVQLFEKALQKTKQVIEQHQKQ